MRTRTCRRPRDGRLPSVHARELAQAAPVVKLDDEAVRALGTLADSGLPGLVIETDGSFIVVPASQVLRVALPRYVLDDAALARVWDEASADGLARRLVGRRVADLVAVLERDDDEPSHTVDGDANLVEIAAVMAAAHVPLVAVVDNDRLLGVVTVNNLIGHLRA